MVENQTILKGRLDGKQRNRLKGLFDMLYSPGELAEELGINQDQIYRVYLPLGCPYIKEDRRHYQINGKDFKKWYLANYQKAVVNENQSFCKTCKKPVMIVDPINIKSNGLEYIISKCPNCGRKLSKIIDCKKGWNDKQK